jgi:glucose/arabinose dehydrogenase
MRSSPLAPGTLLSLLLLAAGAAPAGAQATLPADFTDQLVVGGLDVPTGIAFLPDGRLIVIELVTARVRVVDGTSMGSPDPMGVVDSVASSGAEQGLLGVAVDPGWPARPYLYFQYTHIGQLGRITRYAATGDPGGTGDRSLALDPASRRVVLQYPDDNLRHNGASLHFGPDGMLYSSLGDDQVECAAQDLTQLKGKILRLDVSRIPPGAGPPPPNALLAPPDNPFAAHADSNARLVYAYGLRNPFSFAIDPWTGHLFIADVGGNLYEEIDWAPSPGMNFGWPHREGPARRSVTCPAVDTTGFVGPIAIVPHTGPNAIITAGVYRAPAGATRPFPPDYSGDVFFNDFYQLFVRRLRFDGALWQPAPPAPGQPDPDDWATGNVYWIPAWAIAPDGSWYLARMWTTYPNPDGQIRRIVHTGTLHSPPSPTGNAVPLAARPVPASGPVRLSFTLARPGAAGVAIHDVGGRLVREVLSYAQRPAGPVEVAWDGRDAAGLRVPAGLYMARLSVDGVSSARRLALLR